MVPRNLTAPPKPAQSTSGLRGNLSILYHVAHEGVDGCRFESYPGSHKITQGQTLCLAFFVVIGTTDGTSSGTT